MKIKNLLSVAFFCSMLIVSSCKKEGSASWDTELLAPLANTSLSIANLVKDSSIVKGSDNSLKLVYTNELYRFNLADQIISIPDTFIGASFKLDSLKLANQSIFYNLTLGTLAQSMKASADANSQFIGNFILNSHGTNKVIPALNNFPFAPFPFDATAYFTEVVLKKGFIEFNVTNNFPIPMQNITLELRNGTVDTLILVEQVANINPGETYYSVRDVSGAKFDGNLKMSVTSMSTPGSSGVPVPIDTTDNILMKFRTFDMIAQEATARFPNQDIVSVTEDVTQEIGDRKFTYVDCRQGFLRVYITSSVEERLNLKYTLVGAYDKMGRPLIAETTVPAAPVGSTVTIDKLYDLTGFSIDLTGKNGDKFNTYTQLVQARIDSSGQLRKITLDDSLIVRYELKDIRPNYIKGYAGKDTVSSQDSSSFAALGDLFKSGTVTFDDVNMKFNVQNGMGIDGIVKINSLTAKSPLNGTKAFSGSILSTPLNINRATDFPFTPSQNSFTINKGNSNITDIISMLPNRLDYNIEVKTNQGGNNNTYRDFAYLESDLRVNLDVEVPLSFIASNLVLMDTIDFDLSNTNTNVEGITDGVLNLITKNGYPIDAELTAIIVDENYITVDTLTKALKVESGILDANCKVSGITRGVTKVEVNQVRVDNLKRGRHAIILAKFSTSNNPTCSGRPLQIMSTYKLDVVISAKFNYKANVKL